MTDTPLVVDALNFLTQYFMPVDKMPGSTPAWRLLAAMKVGVEGFLKACAASGFSPHFVIDAALLGAAGAAMMCVLVGVMATCCNRLLSSSSDHCLGSSRPSPLGPSSDHGAWTRRGRHCALRE